jgi:hypothetical protein
MPQVEPARVKVIATNITPPSLAECVSRAMRTLAITWTLDLDRLNEDYKNYVMALPRAASYVCYLPL